MLAKLDEFYERKELLEIQIKKLIEKYKQKLKSALDSEGIAHTDKFYFFGYNAPYEVFNRKNEVIVELRLDALAK